MSKPFVPRKAMLAVLIITSVLGAPLPALSALSRVNPVSSENTSSLTEQYDGVLVAGLSFRLPIRASRWRFGGFARACAAETNALDINALQQAFTPVAPPLQPGETESSEDAPVDLTVSAHPTILVRVPDLPGATLTVTLQNEDATAELYATQVELTGNEKGIVGIQVPTDVAPMEVGQKYAWQAMISASCGAGLGNFRLSTGSWLERVEPDSQLATVDQLPLRDRPNIYASAGIWQETVSTLAELRLQEPNDGQLNESWSSVMESVGLDALAADPILLIHAE